MEFQRCNELQTGNGQGLCRQRRMARAIAREAIVRMGMVVGRAAWAVVAGKVGERITLCPMQAGSGLRCVETQA